MKDILKIVFVIIGTLIGAGFASGQEIYIFFFSHGLKGLLGILISSVLMGIVIYKSFKIIQKNPINTYKEFLETILKNKQISNTVNFIINTFILVTFFIMIAGFGAYFEQELGINNIIGSSILSFLCFTLFMTSIKGIVKANAIIVPILIAFLGVLGIIILPQIPFSEIENYIIETNKKNYVINAILYTSYNSILLIPVLITLKNYLKNKKQIINISIITIIIVIILSSIIFLILAKVDVDIKTLEMPAVYVVSNMLEILKYGYGFVILASIFTTSISLGTSFLQNTTKNKKQYIQIATIICITSIITSKIGFSNLVNYLYPIFGYLGFSQILIMIKTNWQLMYDMI